MSYASGPELRRALPWQPQFVLLSAMWGTSFLLIKIGEKGYPPLQVALGRLLVGALSLMLILAVRGERLPRDPRTWGHLAVTALLFNAVPFTLFAYGETRVSSVLAGIWNATTPLLTLLVAVLVLPAERATPRRTAGLTIGFAGVLVVLGVWRGLGGGDLLGSLLCVGAAACYAIGFPYTRRYVAGRPESVVAISAAQVLCGAAELALVAPFLTSMPSGVPVRAVLGVLTLGALSTGVAYVINYRVIRAAGATVASSVTYLVTIFSTLAGAVFLREPLSWNQPVGAAIIIAGAAVSQGMLRRRARRPARSDQQAA